MIGCLQNQLVNMKDSLQQMKTAFNPRLSYCSPSCPWQSHHRSRAQPDPVHLWYMVVMACIRLTGSPLKPVKLEPTELACSGVATSQQCTIFDGAQTSRGRVRPDHCAPMTPEMQRHIPGAPFMNGTRASIGSTRSSVPYHPHSH